MENFQLSLRITKDLHAALHDAAKRRCKAASVLVREAVTHATAEDVALSFLARVRNNAPAAPYDKKTMSLAPRETIENLESLAAFTGLSKDTVLNLLLEHYLNPNDPRNVNLPTHQQNQ